MKQKTRRSSREESLGLHEMTGKTLIFTNTISTYHAASSNAVPFQAAHMSRDLMKKMLSRQCEKPFSHQHSIEGMKACIHKCPQPRKRSQSYNEQQVMGIRRDLFTYRT